MGNCRQNTPSRALSRLDFMGRLSAAAIAVVLAAAAALGLAACGEGGGDLLPGGTASEISSNLDQVQALVAEGECVGAEDAALQVRDQIDSLEGVDPKLVDALREGATRLTVVVEECQEAPEEEVEEPAIETAVEPEEDEKKEKREEAAKPKPEKSEKEADEAPATQDLPPQAKGEAKGHEQAEEAPPAETGGEAASGGVGPGVEAGGP